VAVKELADNLLSVRFTVLLVLLGLVVVWSTYAASGLIQEVAPQTEGVPALFLRLFTVELEEIPFSFLTLVEFVAPLLGIAFGFDAINGERSQGTLPRLVAQPIHRDDVINGKFAAGISVIGLVFAALTTIVAGVGLFRLGIVPSAGDAGRLVAWLLVTMLYVSLWLGLAMLASVVLRWAATSALVLMAGWLILTIFWFLVVGLLSDAYGGLPDEPSIEEQLRHDRVELMIQRVSPRYLYDEITFILLTPEQTFSGVPGFNQLVQLQEAGLQTNLSLPQSLLLVWPQIVTLVAVTVIVFAAAYILFMRQEIRA
jgi:ABC-2 type transport system permease protein